MAAPFIFTLQVRVIDALGSVGRSALEQVEKMTSGVISGSEKVLGALAPAYDRISSMMEEMETRKKIFETVDHLAEMAKKAASCSESL